MIEVSGSGIPGESDDRDEHSFDDARRQAPFTDQALRLYLDALPSLISQGCEGSWFACCAGRSQFAVAATREQAEQEFLLAAKERPNRWYLVTEKNLAIYWEYYANLPPEGPQLS